MARLGRGQPRNTAIVAHGNLYLPPGQPRNVAGDVSVPGQASISWVDPPGQLLYEDLFATLSPRWAVSTAGTASTPSVVSGKLNMSVTSGVARALLDDIFTADGEINVDVTINDDVTMIPTVSFRGDGVWDPADDFNVMNNGYALILRPVSNNWSVFRRDSGVNTLIDTDTLSAFGAGSVLHIRIKPNGSTTGVRVWVEGVDTEPTGSRSVTTSSYTTQTRVGLSLASSAGSVDWDNFRLTNLVSPAIYGYRVTVSGAGGPYVFTGAASPIIATGLASGPYTATVEALNAGGYGPASFSQAFTVGTANTMSIGGGLAPAAAAAKLDARLAGGAILPTSVAAKLDARLAAGAVAPAAALAKLNAKLAAGTVAPASTQVGVKGKALSAAIAPAGAATTFRTIAAALAGGLAPAGALARLDKRLAAGAVVPAGFAAKRANKANVGVLTPAGSEAGVAGQGRSFGGGITPAATLTLPAPNKNLGGTLTPTGNAAKFRARALAGGITPFGIETRLTRKSYGGTIAPGNENVPQSSFLTGTLAPAGSLRRFVLKSLAGSLTPASSTAKAITHILDGGHITPASTLTRTLPKNFAGAIAPSGALAAAKSIRFTVTGAITPLSTVLRAAATKYGAVLGPAGALRRTDAKTASGTIAPAGAIVPANTMSTAGAVVPTASLRRFASKLTTGVIAPIGDTPGNRSLHPIAEITPAGSVKATSAVSLKSDMFLAGNPARRPGKATGGTVAPAGAALVEFGHFFGGLLAPVGATLRNTLAVLRGAVTPTGTVSRPFPRSFAGSLSPSSVLARLVGSSLDPVLRRPLRATYDDISTHATYTSEA